MSPAQIYAAQPAGSDPGSKGRREAWTTSFGVRRTRQMQVHDAGSSNWRTPGADSGDEVRILAPQLRVQAAEPLDAPRRARVGSCVRVRVPRWAPRWSLAQPCGELVLGVRHRAAAAVRRCLERCQTPLEKDYERCANRMPKPNPWCQTRQPAGHPGHGWQQCLTPGPADAGGRGLGFAGGCFTRPWGVGHPAGVGQRRSQVRLLPARPCIAQRGRGAAVPASLMSSRTWVRIPPAQSSAA
jgi:hypothetical protein